MEFIAPMYGYVGMVVFGILAIVMSFIEERQRKRAKAQERQLLRQIYELTILNNISDNIGYSLNLEQVAETIVSNIEKLLKTTSVSYAILSRRKIKIKSRVKNGVSNAFVDKIHSIVVKSLNTIDPETKTLATDIVLIPENDSLSNIAKYFDMLPLSYFNIPLVINNKVSGIISVASHLKNHYQEEDMTMMYKIVNTASRAIGRIEALIETEKGKTDSLISSLSSGAILFLASDKKLILSTINNAAKNFLNLPDTEINERVVFSDPIIGEIIKQNTDSVLASKKRVILDDTVFNGKHLKIFINPVFYYGGEDLLGISITIQDVTIEKEIEELRDNFTNMIVHELRAPLSAIHGASKLLMSGKLKKEDSDKMLKVIDNSITQGMEDISDLLDAAKIDSGRLTINKKTSDINKLVKERAEEFSFSAKEKNVTISCHTQVGIPQFSFDELRIGQVLNNLISNSIKFTRENGKITIQTRVIDDKLEVLVEDTGVGIPKDKIGVLFSKYGQLGAHITKNSTGLGLYISKGIITSHGGEIRIESVEGIGTKVYFTIPMQDVIKEEQVIMPERFAPQEKILN